MQRPSRSTTAHRVQRALIAAAGLVVALALILPAAASAAAVRATVHFPNHNPIAGKNWVITWTATQGHTKLSGSDSYEFFIGGSTSGSPVRTEPGVSFRNGKGRDTLKFPGEAVGHQLTLVVVIKTSAGTVKVPWVVTTKK
jgi:opacity protein-like surface antigen